MLKLVKDQIPSFSIARNFFRHFAAKKNEAPKAKRVTKRKISKKKETPSKASILRVTEHLESIGSKSLVNEFSEKYLKILRKPHNLYIADQEVANEFTKMIEKDIVMGSSSIFVAEINPGVGLLTKSLLRTAIPKIYLFETSSSFVSSTSRLQLLVKKYPNRLVLRKHNLLKMWEAAFLDFKDGGKRLHEILEGTEKRKWNEEPYMKIVGAIPNDTFIKHLLMSVIFQNTFMEYGRIIFYLAMPPLTWEKLTASKETVFYKNRSVLFQVLFNYKKIGNLPRKSFVPWIVEPLLENRESKVVFGLRKLEYKSLYLVRMEPKADLFDDKLNQEDLLRFFYFVKHHFQVKQTRIIPALEKWIPHCGPRLIAQDINIYTEFRQLSPNELLKLYKEFSSWPEFETSQFLTCMTSFVSRIEEAVLNFDAKYLKVE